MGGGQTQSDEPLEKKYTGQIKDENTTLQYYNARYYDPVLSRFISADSVQGGNRFAYAMGNPIMNNDPSGHMLPIVAIILAALAIVAIAGGAATLMNTGNIAYSSEANFDQVYPPHIYTPESPYDLYSSNRLERNLANPDPGVASSALMTEAGDFAAVAGGVGAARALPGLISNAIPQTNIPANINEPVGVAGIKATRRIETQQTIVAKYGLPSRELRVNDPLEYIRQLKQIAAQNEIPVRPAYEFQPFFRENPMAGAVFMEGSDGYGAAGVVVESARQEVPFKAAGNLAHELVHGLQNKSYPRMSIWRKEYEAYLGVNTSVSAIKNPEIIDSVGTNIGISVRNFYNNR